MALGIAGGVWNLGASLLNTAASLVGGAAETSYTTVETGYNDLTSRVFGDEGFTGNGFAEDLTALVFATTNMPIEVAAFQQSLTVWKTYSSHMVINAGGKVKSALSTNTAYAATLDDLPNAAKNISKSNLVARIQAKLNDYPQVIDSRTGRHINLPSSIVERVPKSQRVAWGAAERGEFIAEWHRRGYGTPKGGWEKYDIHHIHPREFGGTNDFWNLVPVERGIHETFNAFWREFLEL